MSEQRILTFAQALREATVQEMERDERVCVLGLDVDDFRGIYGTTKDLHEQFGRDRSFHTPLAEDGMTGVAIGMAMAGLRPIHVHIRMDFLMLAMNQLVNIAAKARYSFGGQVEVPLVVRSIIGRSWGQGPQHSQGLHSLLMHIPGLRVVAPMTPYDAKGALVASIRDNDPVMFVEHRMVHFTTGHVPERLYATEIGKARVLREGSDITIVGISYYALEAMRAALQLEKVEVSAEVIDPIWLSPLDVDTIAASVRKTGRLLVVDSGWTEAGASAEIAMRIVEELQGERAIHVARMGFAPVTCPTTRVLENLFYPNATTIAATAYKAVREGRSWAPEFSEAPEILDFKGPF